MDLSKTGNLIKKLRHEMKLTQKEIAECLGVCSKTISKWETGRGFPDITLLGKLSEILRIDIIKLLEGEIPQPKKEGVNTRKTKFYVCDNCGNYTTSTANITASCCGRNLVSLTPSVVDDEHLINIEKIEDEFYITFNHPMTKEHFITFFAYVRFDRVLTIKLYPEQGSEVRFPQMHGGKLYFHCNKHGLFEIKI